MDLRFRSFASLSCAASLAFLLGCGSTNDEAAVSPCVALGCAASQKACIEDAAGARCEPCPVGQYAALSGACEALSGTSWSHQFSQFTVNPGQEVKGLCQSVTLGNESEIWVNAVELAQDEASHHSNWMFVPADKFDGPDGVWKCSDRGYSQLDAALVGGVLYAQSTQAEHEVQKFIDGAAVRIPPYSRIIGDVHLLNTATTPITGSVTLTLYSIPAADVKHPLVPFHLTYKGLAIPPHAKSRFVGECDLTGAFAASGATFTQRLHYILPHTHAMGKGFFVEILGGPRDGETILRLPEFDGEAHGRVYSQPIDTTGAEGYRFGCEYHSERNDIVGWGFGDQEMCELLGFAESAVAFESTISAYEEVGLDGDVRIFSAPCTTLAFPWDPDKPGGPPPP